MGHAVLGIDAAWTINHPSGVALVAEHDDGWELIGAASSYGEFQDASRLAAPTGSRCDPAALLSCSNMLCGGPVSVVAVDMPLARSLISRRRPCDNAISRMFGRAKCGTHSPSALRPGPVSVALHDGFARAGYALCTTTLAAPCVIEVYPHPALLALCDASVRIPYKAAKVGRYWPELSSSGRRSRLYEQWSNIVQRLDREISGVAPSFPLPALNASGIAIKAYEDRLDAVVCAWVGICALKGRALAIGDEDAAIWVPARPVLSTSLNEDCRESTRFRPPS